MCYDYCILWWWKRKRNSREAHTIISQATLGPGAKITGPFEYLPRMLRNSKYWLYLIYIIYTWAGRYSNEFFRHASGHTSKALDFKCLRFCPRCDDDIFNSTISKFQDPTGHKQCVNQYRCQVKGRGPLPVKVQKNDQTGDWTQDLLDMYQMLSPTELSSLGVQPADIVFM